MTDISQVGNDWELYIDACVQFGDGTESCVSTNTVTMQVRDPCIITDVNSASIDRMLQASYSTPDIYDVTGWPFSDSVDLSTNPIEYGSGKCGRVLGMVIDANGNQVDFASFDNNSGKILLTPLVDTIPDTYTLYVRYYMESYPMRFTDEVFVA